MDEFPLPRLNAVVVDFPQEHLDPSHDVVGMLGMEMLELFDTGEGRPVLHDSTWLFFLCPLCASSAGVVVL